IVLQESARLVLAEQTCMLFWKVPLWFNLCWKRWQQPTMGIVQGQCQGVLCICLLSQGGALKRYMRSHNGMWIFWQPIQWVDRGKRCPYAMCVSRQMRGEPTLPIDWLCTPRIQHNCVNVLRHLLRAIHRRKCGWDVWRLGKGA